MRIFSIFLFLLLHAIKWEWMRSEECVNWFMNKDQICISLIQSSSPMSNDSIQHSNPVKNVIRILMEIPRHFMSQIDGNLVQIDTNSHDYSMSFIQVSFVFHAKIWHGFLDKFKSCNFHVICVDNDGISHADLVSFPVKLPSKRHEKIRVTFFTGKAWN